MVFYSTLNQTRQTLCEKFAGAFDAAITLDGEKRANDIQLYLSQGHEASATPSDTAHYTEKTEKGETVYEKNDNHAELSLAEKINNFRQTALMEVNPIRLPVLDSIFRAGLGKQGIVAYTFVAYYNPVTHETTHNDTTDYMAGNRSGNFLSSFYPTEKRTCGVRNEFTLQGYVKVTPLTVFRYALLPFVLLLAGVLAFAGWLVYLLIMRRRAFTEPWLDAAEKTFFCRGKTFLLSGDQFRLFECIWSSEEHNAPYKKISFALYGELDIEAGKDRMAHTIKSLRNVFKGQHTVVIENEAQKGYRIRCKE
jgi:hypothetical protein